MYSDPLQRLLDEIRQELKRIRLELERMNDKHVADRKLFP